MVFITRCKGSPRGTSTTATNILGHFLQRASNLVLHKIDGKKGATGCLLKDELHDERGIDRRLLHVKHSYMHLPEYEVHHMKRCQWWVLIAMAVNLMRVVEEVDKSTSNFILIAQRWDNVLPEYAKKNVVEELEALSLSGLEVPIVIERCKLLL
jgi:hypothetical protein